LLGDLHADVLSDLPSQTEAAIASRRTAFSGSDGRLHEAEPPPFTEKVAKNAFYKINGNRPAFISHGQIVWL
jgi:hypothetical protein